MKSISAIFILVILSFYPFNAKGDNKSEKQLIYLYNNVEKAASQLKNLDRGDDLVVAYSDSLEDANTQLISMFLKTLSDNSTLQENFAILNKETRITVVQSKDKKIRFFSWDTFMGGTMDQIASVAQYTGADGKNYAKIINSAGLFLNTDHFVNGPSVAFDRIYEIDTNNLRYYFATGQVKCDNMCVSNQIYAYSISNSLLIYPKTIVSDKIATNNLSFSYDLDNLKIKWEPKFIVDEKKRIILKPIILKDKAITQKNYKRYSIMLQKN